MSTSVKHGFLEGSPDSSKPESHAPSTGPNPIAYSVRSFCAASAQPSCANSRALDRAVRPENRDPAAHLALFVRRASRLQNQCGRVTHGSVGSTPAPLRRTCGRKISHIEADSLALPGWSAERRDPKILAGWAPGTIAQRSRTVASSGSPECVEMATRRARKEVASAAPTACREGVQVRHSRRCQARAGQPAPAHLATRRRSRRHDRAGTVRGSVARAAALVRTDRIVRDRFQRANRYEPWHTPTEATINRRSGRAS
jgi:hypothetical protein